MAAIALPLWQPIAAQKAIGSDEPVMAEMNDVLNYTFKANHNATPYEVVPNRAPVPQGYARVTLAVGISWINGYGYQMLLDENASVYSSVSQYGSINSGNYATYLAAGSNAANNIYNQCEYKIPEEADPAANTQNVVLNDQASILIPAGTYDYAITVPMSDRNRICFATNRGDVNGRGDNYVFESGKSYVFYVLGVQENGTAYDAVFLDLSAPYMALLSGDGEFGDVQIGEAKTATLTVMNTGEEAFTPKVACDNPAFTITSTSSGKLASGASRNYVVTFAPTALQDYNATFTVTAEETEAYDINYTTQLSGAGIGDEHQGDPSGGDNQSSMFPVYGQYFNYGTQSQMIYPASMLEAQGIQTGDIINSLTFYVQGNGTVPSQLGNSQVAMRLGKTSENTVTSVEQRNNNRTACGDPVFTGNLSTGQNTLTIKLSTPYQYQGGNLIVDFVVTRSWNNSATCTWAGVNRSQASYNTRNNNWNGSNTTNTQGSFLPEISIGFTTMPELEATTSLNFGTVSVGNGEAKTAIIKNETAEEVQATITVSPNPPFSVANSTITIAANSFAIIPVTFMPKTEGDFSGTLTVGSTTIPLTGAGVYSGAEATRDKAFFDGIKYNWPIGTTDNESSLSDIATDPEQIIALLREVYMNKNIPGNYYRGHTATGGKDHDNEVPYTGVGIIESNTATECADSYGWNIPGNVLQEGNYRYMDPVQYKPNEEGVTLLLVEMVDNFKKPDGITEATTTYNELKNYIEMSIKSVRVITDARRTGEGIERGTLFKIDCDKMNKFYLLAKGQLLWFDNLKSTISYSNPAYYNGSYSDEGLAFDYLNGPALLCHMFEQFSPSAGNAEVPVADLYWDLIEMQSFGVIHDCPNVPFVQNGHHFMMYGSESSSDDCQDVRDMMFFVPDYRMLEHINRGSGGLSANRSQDYFRYNTKHQPTMGLFVIHQNDIPEGDKDLDYSDPNNEEVTGLYKHQLSWKSNLDDYLPGEEQYYELWELVVDDFGVESYVPVYYRNAQGQYQLNNNTWVSDTTNLSKQLKPVKLERVILETGQEGFSYDNVYVDMKEYSQVKTYVIRGRDQGEFLSLQMSNQQEILIPGTDPREKAHMIGATYYSRYNADPQKQLNCYSNRLELSNLGMTLTADDLSRGVKFTRMSRPAQVDANGNVMTDANGNILYVTEDNEIAKTTVATGTANGNSITLTLNDQSPATDYPNGTVSGTAAGYHANTNLTFGFTVDENNHVHFTNGLSFWDNFTVGVAKNAHPLQYLYKMEIGEEGQADYAYSNNVRVPVYKTDTKINSYSLAQVNADTNGDLKLKDTEFNEKVQLSSKTEILRYDVYRWKETDPRSIVATVDGDDEQDLPPTGIAGNQGESYSITMNANGSEYYYVGDEVPVSTSSPQNWVTFVDYYPMNNTTDPVHEYLYAPVVELRTKGYKLELDDDNNKVPRDDYNTYGGPQQTSAAGKLELEVIEPVVDGEPSVMSSYTWTGDDGKEYAYYNLYLKLKRTDNSGDELPVVPEGYQFYKVRAWRQILKEDASGKLVPAPEYLGEQEKYADNEYIQARMGDETTTKYKLEEFTYPECVVDISDNQAAMNKTEEFGSEDVEIEEGVTVKKGTFGALKSGEGSDVEFTVRFIVRIYFAPTGVVNQAVTLNGSKAPQDDLKNFYVVEDVKDYKIDSDVPTAINTIFDTNREVVGVKYYNVAGIESSTPFDGVNIVVTRYSDGSTTTTKILK